MTVDDVPCLLGRLRQSDEDEVQAAMGITADEALTRSVEISTLAWIGFNGDRAVLAFGVGATSFFCRQGSPWMLGTDEVEAVGLAVVRNSRHYVRKMLAQHPFLENYTDDRHTSAHAWLKWCGFTMEAPAPYGVAQLPFRRFWMER